MTSWLMAAVCAMLPWASGASGDIPAPARQRELVHVLHQDCGSCHGLTLRGGLGPALTPEALRERPPEGLVATIVAGRPGTAMPPWGRFFTESEARWLVDQLRNGNTDAPR